MAHAADTKCAEHRHGPARGFLSRTGSKLDLLLKENDLPSNRPEYFQFVSKEDYYRNFSVDEMIKIYEKGARNTGDDDDYCRIKQYAMVMPLVSGLQMIPIPFIIDTGAPYFIYLCTLAIHQLHVLNVIEEGHGLYPYQLIGNLLGPSDRKLENPQVDFLPLQYKNHTPNDLRLNLLGIKAIHAFWRMKPLPIK